LADKDTIIDEANAVNVSYPLFWEQIDLLVKKSI